jgi:hypothetical protein
MLAATVVDIGSSSTRSCTVPVQRQRPHGVTPCSGTTLPCPERAAPLVFRPHDEAHHPYPRVETGAGTLTETGGPHPR